MAYVLKMCVLADWSWIHSPYLMVPSMTVE
jgi:hypothetical protein